MDWKISGSITGRTILFIAVILILMVSSQVVFLGYPAFTLITQSIDTLVLMGILFKVSDIAKEQKERRVLEEKVGR